jgi:hypothetical protein
MHATTDETQDRHLFQLGWVAWESLPSSPSTKTPKETREASTDSKGN